MSIPYTIIHDEPNTDIITELWAVFSVDEGGEGLMVVPLDGVSFPLITGRARLVPQLEEIATRWIAKMGSQKRHHTVRFVRAEERPKHGT